MFCAPGGIRTPNNGSEDRRDIHFTTRALVKTTTKLGKYQSLSYNFSMNVSFEIPKKVSQITQTLENKGFSAYLVGGCVRDLVMNRQPKDWDITTNATPEEIIELFPKTVYENSFGTVTVVNEDVENESLRHIEITPFRTETKYSDKRHPDQVKFSQNIEDDLKRRDFTINALSYRISKGQLIDLFGGIADIKDSILKTVGSADERFDEDPLRILRGIRLSTELGFTIDKETETAIINKAKLLKHIAKERIRDEVSRITKSDQPMHGYILMQRMGILAIIAPEIEAGVGITQNKDHIYDVWEHSLRALQHSALKDWPLPIRLSALFHDIGKPKTRRWHKDKNDWTFYGHDVVGAKITEKVLTDLKYPNDLVSLVVKLVRNHMFFSDIDQITLSAVRRIINKVGREEVWDLMKVRMCDRIGMGRPKESPYRLRKYESMIDEALRDPTSVTMLKIDGNKIIKTLNVKPGPKIGQILHALLEEVLNNPRLNTEEYLIEKTKELNKLDSKELEKLAKSGKNEKDKKEAEELKKIRKKHHVD